jgi:hypothetical protein
MNRVRDLWIEDWLDKHPDYEPDDAIRAWEAVSPENKGHLLAIDESRHRAFINIQTKLLKELDNFPELPAIKEPFRRAIMNLQHP